MLIGAFVRPEFSEFRVDWGAVKKAAELAALFRRGDNGLLVGLAGIFEREGVRVVGAHHVAPGIVAPLGRLGARALPPMTRRTSRLARGSSTRFRPSTRDRGR